MNLIAGALLPLLLPSTLITLCCIIGTALYVAGRSRNAVRRIGATLLGIGVGGLALVLLFPIDQWVLLPLENRFPRVQTPPQVDGIVVLGGGMAASITASRDLPVLSRDGERLVAFAGLARAYPNARLVFAGGPHVFDHGKLTEAEASLATLQQLGVPPQRILVEDQSRTTWENAVNSFRLTQPKSGETWVLVTSADHMPRAMGAFRAAGWPTMIAWPAVYRTVRSGPTASPRPVGAKLAAIDVAAHEWLGLLAYWIQGRSDSLLPGP